MYRAEASIIRLMNQRVCVLSYWAGGNWCISWLLGLAWCRNVLLNPILHVGFRNDSERERGGGGAEGETEECRERDYYPCGDGQKEKRRWCFRNVLLNPIVHTLTQ